MVCIACHQLMTEKLLFSSSYWECPRCAEPEKPKSVPGCTIDLSNDYARMASATFEPSKTPILHPTVSRNLGSMTNIQSLPRSTPGLEPGERIVGMHPALGAEYGGFDMAEGPDETVVSRISPMNCVKCMNHIASGRVSARNDEGIIGHFHRGCWDEAVARSATQLTCDVCSTEIQRGRVNYRRDARGKLHRCHIGCRPAGTERRPPYAGRPESVPGCTIDRATRVATITAPGAYRVPSFTGWRTEVLIVGSVSVEKEQHYVLRVTVKEAKV